MSDRSPSENDFLNRINTIVEKNIGNEQFGVTELADEMNMSRSNLLRKIKKLTNLSVSQLISQVRLKWAKELLLTSSFNVSEISHQVGFSSTSYFIKCFREHYGYPPGEAGKREAEKSISPPEATRIEQQHHAFIRPAKTKRNYYVLGLVTFIITLAIGLLIYFTTASWRSSSSEKSIAVLPFKNDSNDSSNVYLINGLMESTVNNLQQIKDLKIISRTSAEKYRNSSKTIPEMAKELGVNYFVEGSGQKIGDRILLNIQLIDALNDRHLWSKQYRRESKDIFSLQQEIAKNIAEEIEVIITPEEESRIEKNPTDDLEAYDFFLKGKDLFYKSTSESLQQSIPYFKKAIEKDNNFALAYANAVMVYYYLDMYTAAKKYTKEINTYADKAFLFDGNLPESLIAKALSYAHKNEYEPAVLYLEKALEHNHNAGLVIHFLTEFYSIHVPNTAKYVTYAFKGATLDIASQDSVTIGFKYFHLSNALLQAGFIDEAGRYIDKSLAFNPKFPFSETVKALILYAQNKDLKQARDRVVQLLAKDTNQLYVIEEAARLSYLMRDFKGAYIYYNKLIDLRDMMRWDIFKNENLKMGIVLANIGLTEKSEKLIDEFRIYANNDRSVFRHLNLAMYYSYKGDVPKALEYMTLFSKEKNYQYWLILFDHDPVFDVIKNHPQYKKAVHDIETKFWEMHDDIKVMLDEEELWERR